MGFGLGKSAVKGREPMEKKVFDKFIGVVVDARWFPNNQFNSGPALGVTIMNDSEPSEKVQRVFYKTGKTFTDYTISEDSMVFSSELKLNENSGLAKFTNDLEGTGVDFSDARFMVNENSVNADGFRGIKAAFEWVPEKMRDKEGVEQSYERLTVTKFIGYVDADKYVNEYSVTGKKTALLQVEGVTEELLEVTKDLLLMFCTDAPKSHSEILGYMKTQKEIATNTKLMGLLKDGAFLDACGLKRDGAKYTT